MIKKITSAFILLLILSSCFTPPDLVTIPEITTLSISLYGVNTARCSGLIESTGNDSLWEAGFCWNEIGNPTVLDSHMVCDIYNNTTFSAYILTLDPETDYYIRAYAVNSMGTSYGESVKFSAVSMPTITVGSASDISISTVNIHFIVEDSLARNRTQYICWAMSPNPEDTYLFEPLYDTPDTVDMTLSRLNPNTTYYVWLNLGYPDWNILSVPIMFTTNMPELNLPLPEMISVEGDTFTRGDGSTTYPYRTFSVSDFMIGKYEITQAQFEDIMGRNPSSHSGPSLPVEGITWYEAAVYCNTLSQLSGLQKVYSIGMRDISADFTKNGYRLPTDCEWEFAARGGGRNDRLFSGTNNKSSLGDFACFDENSDSAGPLAVGSKLPNDLGIYDMSGNVFELCWDWHNIYYFATAPLNDPQGPASGYQKVMRGGSWKFNYYYCNTHTSWACPEWNSWHEQYGLHASDAYGHIGFRLAKNMIDN